MRKRLDIFRPRNAHSDAMGLLVSAFLLTGIGLVCVYSFGSGHVLRQAAWAILGIGACISVSRVPPERLRRLAGPAAFATGVLLLVALLFAPSIEGTKRWLVIPEVGFFQPSELAKLAVVLLLADRLARKGAHARGLLQLTWPVLALSGLVLVAPDLGGAVFLASVCAVLLIIAGARIGRVLAVAAATLPALVLVVAQHDYMQRRLEFFQGKMNYQQDQALLALGNGGLLGQGLGAGRQKMHYLPAGHTDFVLPNVGEELGFLGVALVGLLFALLLVYGLRIALAAGRKSRFSFLVACGATFVVVFQAVLNIAVATGAAPTKGISLPFLSQGGSNLLVSLVAVGLVVSVGRSLEARRT